MWADTTLFQWCMAALLLLSGLGVILAKKPLYASLSFLATLLSLAGYYFSLSAEFIAVLQVLVYAGAILVIFVFVIILFQDAHEQINRFPAKSSPILLALGSLSFLAAWFLFRFHQLPAPPPVGEEFGKVHAIGEALYIDFFVPFEAVILLFLTAIVGALYMAKKEAA